MLFHVSDAGMPCVSDPGAVLVDFCIKNQILMMYYQVQMLF